MTYNTTAIDSSVNLPQYIVALNTLTNGWVAGLIMLFVFVISFISMKAYDTIIVFITASFITALVAVLLWGLGMLAVGFIFVPIAFLFGGLIWKALAD